MKNALPLFAVILLFAFNAQAQEGHAGFKPDDRVMFDVSAEDWVTTKTAHVSIAVEAAVTASTSGTMRSDMIKAVNSVAHGDWRLTSFDRIQDQTGMERWSAIFDARLPESELSGLADNAKKQSKAGLQLTVANIDFSPTLEEWESARAGLRSQIYKMANDQLLALNSAMPGRTYRIAMINFTGGDNDGVLPMPRVIKGQAAMAMMAEGGAPTTSMPAPAPVERSEKVSLSARIVFAAADIKPAAAPPSAPQEPKRQ